MLIDVLMTVLLVVFVVTVAAVMATITFNYEVEPLKINEHEGFMERA